MRNVIISVSICLICFQTFCLAEGYNDRIHEGTADYQILTKQNKDRADRNQWKKLLKWPDEFEKKTQGYGPDFSGIEFYDIAASRYIVHVYGSLGAYQGEHLFFHVEQNNNLIKARAMVFDQFSEIEKKVMTTILIQIKKKKKMLISNILLIPLFTGQFPLTL